MRLKEVIYSQVFKNKHRASSRCFTRNRKLPFHLVLFLILNTLRGAVADELDQFFQAVFRWNIPKRFVSPSAFSQARRKLSHTAFLELLEEVCGVVDQAPETVTYRGLRVFAIDGSTMRLPDNSLVRNEFGVTRNKHSECAMSRVSLLHDVLNRVTYDAILGRFSDGEIDMVWEHLEAVDLPERHLILMDRGYYDFATLRRIVQNGGQFCIRLRANLPVYKAFMKKGVDDACIWLKPPKLNKKGFKEDSIFRRGFMVRIVRYRTEKEDYILMTTLLDPEHTISNLGDLYHARWQVEESFKVKKCRLEIEQISGETPEIIRQDFHARVLKSALVAAMTMDCQGDLLESNKRKKLNYKINLTQALAKMKNTLPLLFLRVDPNQMIEDLLDLFLKNLTSIEPGRSYPRKTEGRRCIKTVTYSFAYRSNR